MKINPKAKVIRLPEVVGKGYATYWNFKGRYRVCKGSRASKKSKTTALNIIKRMMQYPEANTLVVRKVFRTLKDSCFTELKWAINRLGVQSYWEVKESPLEMTYIPTGQKIYFRGLDDPLKVTSITVEIGYLCWCWIEEAYEIMNEDDFNMLDESIRGAIPEETGLFKQITLTFNPWNEKHWIRKRFFGEITGKDAQGNPVYKFHDSWISPDGQIFATTTNYLCNEWLDEADLKVFQTMKETNPRRYKVAGLGGWGIVDGLIFENWREEAFNVKEVSAKVGVKSAFGLDFGYADATADTPGALVIKASGATGSGDINLSNVTPYFGTRTLAADMYVVPATQYTTYIMGNGAISYEDIGAKVPYEMARDPKTNGGVDTLYMRQRKVFAPFGISYEKKSQSKLSPTDTELENGQNWTLVHSGESSASSRTYINHKAIPIARIQSLG